MYMDAHSAYAEHRHSYAYTYKHNHMHAHTAAHTLICTHILVRTHSSACTYLCTYTHMHAHTPAACHPPPPHTPTLPPPPPKKHTRTHIDPPPHTNIPALLGPPFNEQPLRRRVRYGGDARLGEVFSHVQRERPPATAQLKNVHPVAQFSAFLDLYVCVRVRVCGGGGFVGGGGRRGGGGGWHACAHVRVYVRPGQGRPPRPC